MVLVGFEVVVGGDFYRGEVGMNRDLAGGGVERHDGGLGEDFPGGG